MYRHKLFFVFLLLEGGLAMAYELASSRLLTPVYGSSSWIWTFVLGITMAGLAFGYKMGTQFSSESQIEDKMSLYVSIASAYCTFITCLFPYIEHLLYLFPFFISLLLSSILVLFIPMTFLGAVSPLCIQYHQKNNHTKAGVSGGNVFFFSTLGGVTFLFLFNLIMLPIFGIFMSIGIYSFILLLISWYLFKKRTFIILAILILFLCMLFYFIIPNYINNEKIVFQSESHYGKLKLIKTEKGNYQVYVNGILQSESTLSEKQLNYYETLLNLIPDTPAKILIIGMGGGTLARLLHEKKHDITAVEINPDMVYVAKHFFLLPYEIKVFNLDGRVFVKRNYDSLKYDIIVLDAFNGEIQPYHLFTKEHFSILKRMLRDSSTKILINWHGYINGPEGYGTRILINTLLASAFEVKLHATPGPEDYRNQILECVLANKINPIVTSEIYTDERTFGELNNALAQLKWRMNYFKYMAYSKQKNNLMD
jgi:SAM-dependent methyltransferase